MTLQQGIAFGLVVVTMAGFAWGKLRYDLVALLSLLAGLILGVVPSASAFDGFKNDVVVIIACALIVSAAIARSGIVQAAARPLLARLKTEATQAPVLAVATTLLSMATKNVGALAIMMPLALQLAARTGTSASRLLMPMSFGSLVGGLVTLVGTSTNIIISQIRQQETGSPFQMFDFAPVGLGLAAITVVYLSLAYRLLPKSRQAAPPINAQPVVGAYATEVQVPEDWVNAKAATVGALHQLAERQVTITALIREGQRRAKPRANLKLRPGDVLMLEGEQEALEPLIAAADLKLVPPQRRLAAEDAKEEVRVMEAVVSPDSPLIGASAKSIGLHRNFEVNLLAVARAGGRISGQLRSAALRAGDVLVIQASERALSNALARLGARPLAEREPRLGLVRRGIPSVLILAVAVTLAALKIAPVALAFFGAAVAMVATGAISMRQVYESLDGQVLVLIAALIPVSEAVQRTGGAALMAHALSQALSGFSPLLALGFMMVAAMLLAPFLHNAPTVLMLGPVAVALAAGLRLNPDAFLMAVAVGAGCDFLTPVGHQCNTLVMGPGGYRFSDYARLGAPLSLLVILSGVPLIAWIWGLTPR
ncbi:MAG: SLC13 family permease [Caulobacteraceae bacterium]